ncbi:SET domain-containing protein-lysine N-methyltransferase [Myxococcus sp. K15C18031901]|uniref:SET domain-containing protein n=1 Tax=Myxococcus dinghuensis TaxID=2906761 RepID=UPI0020A7FEBF|nr:SET domain-containing protein-lysine N-methyltransferase [Myxococcus dinghuensis]MCP3097545.1 SET domain-containing protein-lysine N-methyltransferase [Myxococcus dinghuensis]
MTSPTFTPSPQPLPFELRPSSIQGTGAFATRRIPKGKRIIEYIGERITQEEADVRYDDEAMGRHHTFLFNLDDKTVLDAGTLHNESRYINHSCDPNCEALVDEGHIYIFARKAIAVGEELVYDYAYERTPDMGPESESLYVCKCGAANCRGTILAPEKKAPARKKKASAKKKSGVKKSGAKVAKKTQGKKAASGSRAAKKGGGRKKSPAGGRKRPAR